jgi:hypothetical protein
MSAILALRSAAAAARPAATERGNGAVHRFIVNKARSLVSRAQRLAKLTPHNVGYRAADLHYVPSTDHFRAANRRLGGIQRTVMQRLTELQHVLATPGDPQNALLALAMVEREIDRARRTFGMLFEIFAQRGTGFARSLAAHDAIASDCYAAVRANAPRLFSASLLEPVTYMEHGYSPATMRRGVSLSRLLGETNPFPLIRIPWDREHPWDAVYLHEVAHNLQADMGLWVENRRAVIERLATERVAPLTVSIFGRWHKEIFADLTACLLGGPAVALDLATFLAHPPDKVLTYRPGGPHPTGYLRVFILAEMLRRMEFRAEAAELARIWSNLYDPRRGHRMPAIILRDAGRTIRAIVDEICFQPRRGLAERALASLVRFTREDEARIRRAGMVLTRGRIPGGMPPRFLVSACSYAIDAGADVDRLSRLMIDHLAKRSPATRPAPSTLIAA